MQKRICYTEIAYMIGLVLLALGTAMTAWAGFGISMVVAPAYILYLKLSQILPWFSFGMAEYILQIVILGIMMLLLKQVKGVYFLAIATAVLYGFLLDGAMALMELIPNHGLWCRLTVYTAGVSVCTAAISLLFYSYLPPAAYEMLVKNLAAAYGWQVSRVKTVYDLCSLAAGVGLSLVLLGRIQGVGIGTVICAFCYGWLISLFSKLFTRLWDFQDRFALREKFEERKQNI